MDRLWTYKMLRANFRCEDYLFCVKNKIFRTVMSMYMGGLLKLECNEGRYNNIPFNERICLICKRDIETEYHFLLVCPKLSQIMLKYISPNHPYGLYIRL